RSPFVESLAADRARVLRVSHDLPLRFRERRALVVALAVVQLDAPLVQGLLEFRRLRRGLRPRAMARLELAGGRPVPLDRADGRGVWRQEALEGTFPFALDLLCARPGGASALLFGQSIDAKL